MNRKLVCRILVLGLVVAAGSDVGATITIQSMERSAYRAGVGPGPITESFNGAGNWGLNVNEEHFLFFGDPMIPEMGGTLYSHIITNLGSSISDRGFSWSEHREVAAVGTPFVPAAAHANVNMDVTFRLDSQYRIDFEALVSSPQGEPGFTQNTYAFELRHEGQSVFSFNYTGLDVEAQSFAYPDGAYPNVLEPGQYQFSAHGRLAAIAFGSASRPTDSNFSLKLDEISSNPIVPEPSSLIVWSLLATTGLAAAVWRRKRFA